MSWMARLKQVFAVDLSRCPHGGGERQVIAVITDPGVMSRILEHLGLAGPAQPRARYAMDFEGPARRYAALGTADDIAATICTFHSAGVRTFLFDFLGSPQEQLAQIEQFSREVMPRVSHL